MNNLCLNCGKEVSRKPKKYCNNRCQLDYQYQQYIETWKAGLVDATVGYEVSSYVRRYFHEKYDSSCQLCGWSKRNSATNSVPLELHHVDGNYQNSCETNLQLLCPNCHSLTSTMGVLNKGSGRKFKRIKHE